jgi:hypothetical protein
MSPTITKWISDLTDKCDKPCRGALKWLATLPVKSTISDAWAQCKRSDWMRWAALRSPVEKTDERWRVAACAIIRRVKVRGEETMWDIATDPRSRNAVEVAERFSRGEATKEELASAYAASAYASASDCASDAYAASTDVLREFIPDPWAAQAAAAPVVKLEKEGSFA